MLPTIEGRTSVLLALSLASNIILLRYSLLSWFVVIRISSLDSRRKPSMQRIFVDVMFTGLGYPATMFLYSAYYPENYPDFAADLISRV